MLKKNVVSTSCAMLLAGVAVPVLAEGSLTLSVEPLYLHRDTASAPLTLVQTSSDYQGDVLAMDADDAEFGWGGGVSISLSKNMGAYSWEGGLIYLHHSGTSALAGEHPDGVGGDTQPYFSYLDPTDAGGTIDADPYGNAWKHAVKNESDLLGVEFNRAWSAGESMQWLAGVRLLSLQDKMTFTGWDDDPPVDVDYFGTITTKTSNTMIGLQGGVKASKPLTGNWRVSGGAKAGVYLNRQKKSISYNFYSIPAWMPDGSDGALSYNHDDTDTGLAAAAEASVNLDWLINKTTTLSVGYTAMYIGGVGVAVDQMPLANTDAEFTKHDDSGQTFYHGVKLGLTVIF